VSTDAGKFDQTRRRSSQRSKPIRQRRHHLCPAFFESSRRATIGAFIEVVQRSMIESESILDGKADLP